LVKHRRFGTTYRVLSSRLKCPCRCLTRRRKNSVEPQRKSVISDRLVFRTAEPQCKVNLQFALEQAMKAQMGSIGNSSTLSLISAIDRGGWLTSRPGRFNPRKRPGNQFIGGWAGTRAGLKGSGGSPPPPPPPRFDLRTVQPVARPYTGNRRAEKEYTAFS
jgi:hypothetical protein